MIFEYQRDSWVEPTLPLNYEECYLDPVWYNDVY